MIRTFETRIGKDETAQGAVLDVFADLMCRAERQAFSLMLKSEVWNAAAYRRIYQDLGTTGVLFRSVQTSLMGKIDAVRSLTQNHLEAAERKLSNQFKKISDKLDKLQKAVKLLATSNSKIEKLQLKIDKVRLRIEKPGQRAKAVVQLKKLLNKMDKLRSDLRKAEASIEPLRFTIHQHRRKAGNIEHRIEVLKQHIIKPSMAFGSKKLFQQQFNLEANGFEDHAEWLQAWRKARNSQFLLVGATSAPSGNEYGRLFAKENGKFDLELRLPPTLSAMGSLQMQIRKEMISYIRFESLHFNNGHAAITAALKAGQPITYRFLRDERSWKIQPIIDQTIDLPNLNWGKGCLGVDLNVGHVALCLINAKGNPVRFWKLPCVTHGLGSSQVEDMLRHLALEIVSIAKQYGVPVGSEKLDFSDKKERLAEMHPRHSRVLSGFAYSSFDRALHSALLRNGIHHRRVEPAFTSMIGRVKIAPRYGSSVHAAAAASIARRAIRFSERLPRTPDGITIPLRNGDHVTLPRPERIEARTAENPKRGDRHVWSSWNRLCRGYKAASAKRGRPGRKPRSVDVQGCSTIPRSGRASRSSSISPARAVPSSEIETSTG